MDRDCVVVPVKNPENEFRLLEVATAIVGEGGEIVVVNIVEVPPQISLSQSIEAGSKALESQGSILDQAEVLKEDLESDSDFSMRTRAVVGRDVRNTILSVIDEEDADHLVIGWDGDFSRSDYVLGSNIDPLVREASCEVTVVKKDRKEDSGSVACLVGEGPNTPYCVERADQIRRYMDGELTLINYQEIEEGMTSGEVDKVRQRGRNLIKKMASEVGISDFEVLVVCGYDRIDRLLEAVEGYDFVCIGSVRPSKLSLNTVFGSLPEEVGSSFNGNVLLVMGPEEQDASLYKRLVDWIDGLSD